MTTGSDIQQSVSVAASAVTGIVVALPEELATLTTHKLKQGECLALGDTVLLVYAGAGEVNASKAAQLLIANGVSALISWGCAAALSPHLKPGDLLLPKQLLSEHRQVFNTDAKWVTHAQEVLNTVANTGALQGSRKIVAASTEKQHIYLQTGAVALDMESLAVVQVALKANLPALVVRTVADPVTMDLPQAVVVALDDQGTVVLKTLLLHLLMHPWEIPALIRLGLHFHAAQKTLKTVAKQLLEVTSFSKLA